LKILDLLSFLVSPNASDQLQHEVWGFVRSANETQSHCDEPKLKQLLQEDHLNCIDHAKSIKSTSVETSTCFSIFCCLLIILGAIVPKFGSRQRMQLGQHKRARKEGKEL